MKKYTLFLIVLSFIVYIFIGFNAKFASAAYEYGCTTAGPYNTITGQSCYGAQSQYYGSSNTFLNQQFTLGAKGADVFALQQTLASAGFYFGNIDGVYGPITDSAYNNYLAQYSNNYSYPYTNSYSNTNQNIYPYYYNQTPVISGINGPQTLNVNQIGSWTVLVTGTNNGNLSYSVNWGDQPIYTYGVNNSYLYPSQQSATLTHTYRQMGTYNPIFTVTNSVGQSVSANLSVVVGSGLANNVSPFISSISTSSGRVGNQVTIYGRGFNNNVCNTYSCLNNNNFSSSTINFGMSIIPSTYSTDGTSLTFTIPSYTNSACLYSTPACVIPQYQIIPGTYPIFITNTNGISNTVNFSVTY
ncbi:MAG: hypothetical protein KJ915_04485 [Candidatus Omnitrophica bacterium]|nr:hypothetical protein [Candidatus Omnitrophota bacterium]